METDECYERNFPVFSVFLIFLTSIFMLGAFFISVYLPDNDIELTEEQLKMVAIAPSDSNSLDASDALLLNSDDETMADYIVDYVSDVSFKSLDNVADKGLTLYRQSVSRSTVEWFYTEVTGDAEIAKAILTEADKNDIPLSLAFSLAHTESHYRVRAVGHNTNGTVDRGLFQLNSNSFPQLSEEDFFDPRISAKYGLAHLKLCLKKAGNSVSALAMYNAGMGRVSSNKTPQITLNYIGNIISYQNKLEQQFTNEVVIFYETQLIPVK
ncbi:MAG: transglycosylase SLT domain-containing protein [Treponema sp.]|nr:transglycosylase SLT domain-containing protein [Treponema sp.]